MRSNRKNICIFKWLISILLSGFAFILTAQIQPHVHTKSNVLFSMDIACFTTPLVNNSFIGFNMDFKGYVNPRWSTGLSFSLATKRISVDFGYPITTPIISYNEWSWNNQMDIKTIKGIRLFTDINNGLVYARLGDDHEHVFSYYSKYGPVYLPKKYAENFYYLIEPGLGISIPVYKKDTNASLYVTARAKYRWVIGDGHFATPDQFSNYYLSLGITLFMR